MWREDGVLTIEVEDRGQWRPEREERRGRGIVLMRTLVDRVDIDTRSSGTVVRLITSLDRDDGAQPSGFKRSPAG